LNPLLSPPDFAIQRGVDARHVVTLEIVINVRLPVTVHLIDAALGKLHAGEIELRGLAGQFAQTLGQRGRRVIEVDEDEVEPFLEAEGTRPKSLGPKSSTPSNSEVTSKSPSRRQVHP